MLHGISAFEFINDIDDMYPTAQLDDAPNDSNITLLANATSLHDNKISPEDIRMVLSTTNSNNHSNKKGTSQSIDSATITIDGIKYI